MPLTRALATAMVVLAVAAFSPSVGLPSPALADQHGALVTEAPRQLAKTSGSTRGRAAIDPAVRLADDDNEDAAPPVHLTVATIGVDAYVAPMWLNDDNTLEVPRAAEVSGWWSGGAVPGEPGAAIIVGHVDYQGESGVFHRLHEMDVGQIIAVRRSDGVVARFAVYAVEQHNKSAFPTEAVYGDPGRAELRLITCGGVFNRSERSYTENVIVFAHLLEDGAVPPDPTQ